jgi:hypothetical protein
MMLETFKKYSIFKEYIFSEGKNFMKRKFFSLLILLSVSFYIFSQEAVIINKTGFDLYNVYLTPSGMEEWSEDIQPYDVILNGQYKVMDLSSFSGESVFDFRFIDVDGDEYIKKNVDINLHWKVVVSLDDLSYIMDTIKQTSINEWSVFIRNNTGVSISELYISPHNSNSWGTNLIQNDFMENKNTRQIFMGSGVESIDYDIRMDSSDGSVFIKEIVSLRNNITVVLTSADRE